METRKRSSYGAKRRKSLSFPIPVSQSSISPSTLGMRSVARSLQSAALLRKEGKHNRGLSQADGLRAAQTRERSGKLDC